MAEYTDEVRVLVGDLEIIQAALANAAGLAATHDLQMQFLTMRQRATNSALSKQLQTAVNRVEGYLTETQDEEINVS